jgi:hypothetical protein
VHQHAVRQGLRPKQTDPATTDRLDAILGPPPPTTATGPPDWDATITLLAQA